jgi:thymidylate synthase (FAD)
MEITTTRDIARQILRHRSFSFQEFSQRYADPTNDLGFVTRDARLQDLKNRQNSIDITDDTELKHEWVQRQEVVIESINRHYSWAVANGIAKEQARALLPEGLTVSRLYMSGSVRSWIHYCQLRMGVETQKEHRDVATSAWYELTNHYTSIKDSLRD